MRPSLSATREAEILRALEACVLEFGIAGLTTQRIADKSGYSRSHIRHYLGNKDDQLRELIDVYTKRYASSLERAVAAASGEQKLFVIAEELFGDTWLLAHSDDDVVLDHLNAYAASHPQSEVSLAPMYARILKVIGEALESRLDPGSARERSRVVLALAYGASTMARQSLIDPAEAMRLGRQLLELKE